MVICVASRDSNVHSNVSYAAEAIVTFWLASRRETSTRGEELPSASVLVTLLGRGRSIGQGFISSTRQWWALPYFV